MQPLFYPDKIKCIKCREGVDATYLCIHFLLCQKKVEGLKNSLKVIQEENFETFLSTCKYCKRNFHQVRIEKHQRACEWASKRRPVFDISRKRQSFPSENLNKYSPKRSPIALKYQNSKWQKQHIQLLQSLRESKSISAYLEYIKCQYCSRKFAPNIAENHIEICKNILNKPKPPSNLNKQAKKISIPKIDLKKKGSSHKVFARPSSVLKGTREINEIGFLSTSIEEGQNCLHLSPDLLSTPSIIRLSKTSKNKSQITDSQSKFKFRKVVKSLTERKHSTQNLESSQILESPFAILFECSSCGAHLKSCKFCINCGSLSIVKRYLG